MDNSTSAKSIKPVSGNRNNRRPYGRREDVSSYDHEVLDIARVVRVVKGGRRFRFRASVVVGDRAGKVGFGTGKSRDIQDAIHKAQAQAEKYLITLPLQERTITHAVSAKFKGASIMLRPAKAGTGVIAGGVIRTVAEMAGIADLVSKSYGSSNRISNVRATLKALQSLKQFTKK